LIVLLAVACGMTVANLYYAQPLLSSLSRVFGIGTATAGTLITLTQVGYLIGMLILVPLGDRLEKRRLVTALLSVTTVALAVAGFDPGFLVLLAAALVSGATSVVAQILVPYAASLAPDGTRGRVVGRVMSGLLTGILLSRTVSGLGHGRLAGRLPRLGRPHGRSRGQSARGPALSRHRRPHCRTTTSCGPPSGCRASTPHCCVAPLPGRRLQRLQRLLDHGPLCPDRAPFPLLRDRRGTLRPGRGGRSRCGPVRRRLG
jgi:hypothetical protein